MLVTDHCHDSRNFSEASFEEDLAAWCQHLSYVVTSSPLSNCRSMIDLAELYNNEMQSLLDTLKCVCAGNSDISVLKFISVSVSISFSVNHFYFYIISVLT